MNVRAVAVALLCAGAATPSFPQAHHTATADVAIGATLEITGRTPDLAVVATPEPNTQLMVSPDPAAPDATATATAGSVALGLVQTMWARAHATATASRLAPGSFPTAIGTARARPSLDLINGLDTTVPVTVRLSIPGEFPETMPARFVSNPYFDRGTVDQTVAEYARTLQVVSIIPEWGGSPIVAFDVRRETRTPIPPPDITPGPAQFDTFGVPFSAEYTLMVPPSFVQTDPSTFEIRLHTVRLWVEAEALGASALGGSVSVPIEFAFPSLCELSLPRPIDLLPRRDPLCRAGRAGSDAAPVCSCLRDSTLRNQHCAFTFPDLFASIDVPAPVPAGEAVQADVMLLPWSLGDGEVELTSEILAGGQWIPVAVKAPQKLKDRKESSARISFTMPKRPTILRTRVTHHPLGTKEPVVSEIDTMVALHIPASGK